MHFRPVAPHSRGNTPLHKRLVDTQNPVMGNLLLLQSFPGKENVFLCVGGVAFQKDVPFRYAARSRYLREAYRLRLRQNSFSISAQTAGKEHLCCPACQIQLHRPAGNIRVEIADAPDSLRFNTRLAQAPVIPDHLQRLQ